MGTFGQSFSRELGKNTGKFVSNKVFGDSWSTPYRSQVQINKVNALETQRSIKELDHKNAIEKIELQKKLEKQKQIELTINEIININFNNGDKSIVFQQMSELHTLIESTDATKIKKAAKEKMEAGVFVLKQMKADEEATYFKEKISKLELSEKELELSIKKKLDFDKKILIGGGAVFILSFLIQSFISRKDFELMMFVGIVIIGFGIYRLNKHNKELKEI
jgi:hypothetical protein